VTARDDKARLATLVERCEADLDQVADARTRGDALANSVGGELGLRWRIAVIRAAIEAPPDGDTVRELYGELVDRYRDDGSSLARIKALGDEIRLRESKGDLPSTMVARSDRRKR
jgi:hypothetical protein